LWRVPPLIKQAINAARFAGVNMEIGALGSLGVSVCDAGGEVSGLRECDAPIFSSSVGIS
jgi:hypothetical protein